MRRFISAVTGQTFTTADGTKYFSPDRRFNVEDRHAPELEALAFIEIPIPVEKVIVKKAEPVQEAPVSIPVGAFPLMPKTKAS